MSQWQTATPQNDLIFHLEKAIENEEFEVYFQPIIHTISGSLCGFEALVRWHHPDFGFLAPGQFVGSLEDTKQIYHLDIHVVEKVCQWYAREKRAGRPVVPVSVNLSRIDFESADMFAIIEALTWKYRMPRNMLNIEITESAFGVEGGILAGIIEQFRSVGYQVWMDDFGSGYSSLNTLKDYVFDELKIDMGFLSDMNLRSQRIIASMISMAKDISMVTLVEGVETKEQVDFLRSIGCDRLQGYYFSKPLPYEELLAVLREKNIPFESAEDRRYYHEINRINVLSPSPFAVGAYMREQHGGGIPLALMEKTGKRYTFMYMNDEFSREIKKIGAKDAMDAIQRLVHFGILSHERIDTFLDDVIEKHERSIEFSVNGDLCSARGKLISVNSGRHAILLSINNITQFMNISHDQLMDQTLKNIYSMYLRVSILRPKTNEIVTVFSQDHHNVATDVAHDLHGLTREYASYGVHPEDRDAYLHFVDPATIEARLRNSERGFVNMKIRTLDEDGGFSNKMYLEVPTGNSEFLLLVRYANL